MTDRIAISPIGLSLSKTERRSWFDKLTTNAWWISESASHVGWVKPRQRRAQQSISGSLGFAVLNPTYTFNLPRVPCGVRIADMVGTEKPLSLRERGWGEGRVSAVSRDLVEAGNDPLTPALSRRERENTPEENGDD